MAQQLPMWRQGHWHFKDEKTTDIKLRLICSDGVEYQGNPLYLHSTVLRKSAIVCELWSFDKRPFEVEVTCSHSVDKYIKCFELMYSSQAGESLCFSTVDEALAILPVASELLFHVCIQECILQYLNAVRWTDAQEAQLRALISSLQINTSPDLAARLSMDPCNSDCVHLDMLEEFLPEMLSMISSGIEKHCNTSANYIIDYYKVNASPAVAQKCRSALLKEFRANMDRIQSTNVTAVKINSCCHALLWLVRVIQRCDRELFKMVLQMFCEDSDFRDSLAVHYPIAPPLTMNVSLDQSGEPILTILIYHFLKAMLDGSIITTPSFRHSFLTNWLDIIVRLITQNRKKYKGTIPSMEKGIADLAETLPLATQRYIYNIWKETFRKGSIECHAFEWWGKKLHDAIISQH